MRAAPNLDALTASQGPSVASSASLEAGYDAPDTRPESRAECCTTQKRLWTYRDTVRDGIERGLKRVSAHTDEPSASRG